MEYLIGFALAIAVALFARLVGFERERAFYPTVAIVVSSYYGLFSILGGSLSSLALESAFMAAFVVLAVLGFKRNLWFAAAALAGHGIFDFFHVHLPANPGLPVWWPGFCMTYDVVAGAYLAWLLWRQRHIAPR